MPYAQDYIGIYKIVNNVTGFCYVGQSQQMKKRVKEHFRLLRRNAHPNAKLQHVFNKYGGEQFSWSMEVIMEDVSDLDMLEEMFIKGDAVFDEPTFYNIANFAKAPMRGKQHTEQAIGKMRQARIANKDRYSGEHYRQRLSEGQMKRFLEDTKFIAKVRYIVDNPDMTYAERGRILGMDTSSVRKLALRWTPLKELI